jgi:hypothetical protein
MVSGVAGVGRDSVYIGQIYCQSILPRIDSQHRASAAAALVQTPDRLLAIGRHFRHVPPVYDFGCHRNQLRSR